MARTNKEASQVNDKKQVITLIEEAQAKENTERVEGGKEDGQEEGVIGRYDEEEESIKEKLSSGGPITFEELLQVSGTNGRWKILLFILCACSGFAAPMSLLSYQFLGATPDYWCHVAPLVSANWTDEQIIFLAIPGSNTSTKFDGCQMYNYNYTSAAEMGYEETLRNMHDIKMTDDTDLISCPVRDFNLSQQEPSVVTEWDLVCDRRVLYATTASINQVGMVIGDPLYGYLIDAIGRRPTVLWSSCLTIIVGLLTAGSPTIEVYILMRGLIQAVDSGFYMACFVLAMEISSVRERTQLGALFLIPWALGYMIVPGICIFIQNWRYLQVALTVPSFFLLIYFWLLPESPRWLILQGKFEEALKVLKGAAKFNRKTLPTDQQLLEAMKNIKFEESHLTDVQERRTTKDILDHVKFIVKSYMAVLMNPEVRRRAFLVFFLWFSSAMIYYGVGLNATNISADPYMYIFLGGVMEVLAYLFLWLCLMYIGRRTTLGLLYSISSVAICVVGIVIYSAPEAPASALMALSLCGKLSSTATFHLVWLMTAELFPTKYRPIVIGESGVCGRIGSTCSPYINDILGTVSSWAPSAVFSITSLVSATLVALLPETKGKDLPETDRFPKEERVSPDI